MLGGIVLFTSRRKYAPDHTPFGYQTTSAACTTRLQQIECLTGRRRLKDLSQGGASDYLASSRRYIEPEDTFHDAGVVEL
jgi:hypothetical protein